MQEGTVDFFLREVGDALDDFTISRSADGKLGRERTIAHLHTAQVTVFRTLKDYGGHPSQLARKVTLTEDSENADHYICPPRTIGVFAVEDSNGLLYTPFGSRKYAYRSGFIVERAKTTNKYNNRICIRFMNYSPTGTVYAWVLEEPAKFSAGDGTYAATSITLEASPDVGTTINDDDYYIGTQFIVTQSAAAAFGLIGTATAYVGKTGVATVGTWATTPTANDDYSILCDLPRVTWRQITLEAIRIITRVDKRFGPMRDDMMQELAEVRQQTIIAMRNPADGFDNMPREVDFWVT
jgi:hypothetical protein